MSAKIECLRAKYQDSSGFDTQGWLKFLREEAKRGLPSNKVRHAMKKKARYEVCDPEIRSIATGLFRQ